MGCLLCLIIGGVVLCFVVQKFRKHLAESKWERWNHLPKDKIVMHAVQRGGTIPHGSPFVVKLETFMRMAKIPYETDFGLLDGWGPKGRFPWISINGQHIADTEFIIEFLTKKFDVKLGNSYTASQLAIGSAIRIMMDDHFFWAIPYERFCWGSLAQFKTMMGRKTTSLWDDLRLWLYQWYFDFAVRNRATGHGIGLHSKEEITKITFKDLKALSEIFSDDRKFILGNEPSEYDAAVFAHLGMALWGIPGSTFEKALVGDKEFSKLKDYCWRMREAYYPDWDQLVYKE